MDSEQLHAGHSHVPRGEGNERALLIALGLTTTFLIAEVVGGLLTSSLALLSDAAHMFTDTAALGIALAAIRIGKRAADKQRTFGYYRYEILAASVNAVLLFGVALYILYEAYLRLRNPPEIQSIGMMAIAALGLVVNLVSMRVLSSGKDKSMNMKGAYLEVWSDMLGSIGVIAGALLITWTGWTWIDSLVAVAIGLWVLPRTWILLKASTNVLLEGVPEGVAIDEIESALLKIPGVQAVHDLHIWAISTGKASLTVHLVCPDSASEHPRVLDSARRMLATRFDIHHSTVQIELFPCEQERETHSFAGKDIVEANIPEHVSREHRH
jgi:cobalt-zinc-cadmium efflux system protein